MTVNRRQLMAGAAVAGAAAHIPLVGARAQTEPAMSTAQAPAFQRMTIGDTVVTALSDGNLTLGAQVLPNVSDEMFEEAMRAAFLPPEGYTAPVNAYAVERGGRTILIDAGGSTAMAETLGNLDDNLAAANIAPDSVETILLTHMHPDHIGGLLTGAGTPFFPNAELVVRAQEIDFWTDLATREAMPEARRGMVDAVIAVRDAYEGRTTRFDGDVAVVDGIEAVSLFGHTPGHTGYRITDGDEALLLWGDIVHIAPVQLPRPEIFIGFDTDPEQAVATRLAILEEVASDRVMIAGMHLPFPGFGHIARDGDGYAFVRADWQYGI